MGAQAGKITSVQKSSVSQNHRPTATNVRFVSREPAMGNQAAMRMVRERQAEGDDRVPLDDRQVEMPVHDMAGERGGPMTEGSSSDPQQMGRRGAGGPLIDMGAVGRIIAGVAGRVVAILSTLAAIVVGRIASLISIVSGRVLGRVMALVAGIGRVVSPLIAMVGSLAARLAGTARAMVASLYALVMGRVMALAGPVIAAVSNVIRGVFAALRPFIAIAGIIGRVVRAVVVRIRQAVRMIAQRVAAVVLGVARRIASAILRGVSVVIGFIRRISGVFRNLLGGIISLIRSRIRALVLFVMRAIISWVRRAIAAIMRLAQAFIRALVIFIRGIIVALRHFFRTLVFPSYSEIVANSTVSGAAGSAWTDTKAAANATGRREIAFWIRFQMVTGRYEIGPRIMGPVVGPADGAFVNPGARPADTGIGTAAAVYTVGLFHTHTPTRFRTVGRPIGPSTADGNFHNSNDIAGVVYDYKESPAGSGSIPAGHPLHSAAQLYHSGPNRRSRV